MYLEFYRLNKKPFQISADPEFLWLGDKHREALAALRYGVEDNKGFLLLTGDVGTGKTTLINRLLASLGDDVLAASIPDPGLEVLDFYRYIAAIFNIQEPFASKGEFLIVFRRFLEASHAAGKKVVLIIDEAQRLTQELLEEIRLLSNIERPDAKLVNIFFVGQNEFNGILLQPENRAIRQRITVNYDLQPLTIEETSRYLQHRLLVAGAKEPIFSPAAVQRIHAYSRGYPRLINVIADRCLLTGFVDEKAEIDAGIVMECAQELRIPAPTVPAEEAAAQPPPAAPAAPTAQPTPTAPQQPTATVPPPGTTQTAATPPPQPAARPARIQGLRILLLLLLVASVAAAGGWYAFPQQSAALWTTLSHTAAQLAQRAATLANGWRTPPGDTRPEAAPTNLPSTTPKPPAPASPASSPTPLGKPVVTAPPPAPPPAAAPPKLPAPAAGPTLPPATQPNPPQPKERAAEPAPAEATPGETSVRPLPLAETELDPGFLRQTHIISFRYNSNTLSDEGRRLLDKLYLHLQRLPYTRVEIRGYTDNLGPERYNRRLSLFRANLVKYYLLGKGVPPSKVVASGEGSANPIASNDTREGREQNRRVEVTVR